MISNPQWNQKRCQFGFELCNCSKLLDSQNHEANSAHFLKSWSYHSNYWNNFNCRTWWSLWREKWAVWNLRRRSNVLELPKVSGMFSEDVWMFWRPSMYLVCAIDFRNFSKFVISFAFGEEFCDTLPLMLVLFLFSIARDSLQKIQWNQSHLEVAFG